MGCITSSNKQLFSLKREDVYNVSVLRVQSDVILAGQGVLEITPNEIIYIAPNHEPVSWALQHLRRYGLTEDIFSFEAGRRCATGPGIYTFRCPNADQLYSKFQWYINSMSVGVDRNINTNHHTNFFDRLDVHQQQQHANQYLEPTSLFVSATEQRTISDVWNYGTNLNSPDSLINPTLTSEMVHIPSTTQYSNVNASNNSFNIYMDQPISSTNEHNNNAYPSGIGNTYNNGDLKDMVRSSSLDVPPDECAPVLTPVVTESQRMYSNVDLVDVAPNSTNLNAGKDSTEPTYANVEVNHSNQPISSQNAAKQNTTPERAAIGNGTVVNYIVLDLDQPRSPSQCSPKAAFDSDESLNENQTNGDIFNVAEKLTDALSLPCGSSTMPKRTTMSDARSNFSETKIESSGSYTRIDFLKTFALMKSSTNYTDFDPDHDQDECRITRHSKFVRKAYSISE